MKEILHPVIAKCPLCGRDIYAGGRQTECPKDGVHIPQKDLPKEAAEILYKNLWDLYD